VIPRHSDEPPREDDEEAREARLDHEWDLAEARKEERDWRRGEYNHLTGRYDA
jgi:hypothetical protein